MGAISGETLRTILLNTRATHPLAGGGVVPACVTSFKMRIGRDFDGRCLLIAVFVTLHPP